MASTATELNPLDLEHERKRVRSLLKTPEGRQALMDVLSVHDAKARRVVDDQVQLPIVAMLTPSMDGFKSRSNSAYVRMVEASKNHCIMYPEPSVSTSILHWSRNDLIVRLFKSGKPFDYVLFMDDDMEPEPDALLKLLAHKKDIVAAGCTLRMDPPKPNYRVYEPDTFSFREETGAWDSAGNFVRGLMKTGAIGTAFMLISQDAIRKIADYYLNAEHEKRFTFSPCTVDEKGYIKYEPYDHEKLPPWVRDHIELIVKKRFDQAAEDGNGWWFENLKAPNWLGEYSEDMSFCFKAQQLGIDIWVDTSVKVGHLGDYAYSLDDWVPYADGMLEEETRRRMICAVVNKPFQRPKVEQQFVKTGKVSVMIPSRGRAELLNNSLHSLMDNAKGDIEILVRFDYDDPRDTGTPIWVGDCTQVKIFHGPRIGRGYDSLHEYYNELAKHATGDWLMLWNDDAVMETEGWDEKIRECGGGLKVLTAPGDLNLFPIVSRPLYELLGYISPQVHSDSWLQAISRVNGIEQTVDLSVKHLREELEDKTKDDSLATYRTSRPQFFSREYQDKLYADVLKVKAALNQNQNG
jgi:hypothetical protein